MLSALQRGNAVLFVNCFLHCNGERQSWNARTAGACMLAARLPGFCSFGDASVSTACDRGRRCPDPPARVRTYHKLGSSLAGVRVPGPCGAGVSPRLMRCSAPATMPKCTFSATASLRAVASAASRSARMQLTSHAVPTAAVSASADFGPRRPIDRG